MKVTYLPVVCNIIVNYNQLISAYISGYCYLIECSVSYSYGNRKYKSFLFPVSCKFIKISSQSSESTCNITGLLNYNLLLRLSYRLGNVSVSKSFHKFILKQKQSSKYDAFEITHNRSVCVMLCSNSYGLHCGSLVLITWLLSAIGSTMLRQTIPKD